MGVGVVEVLVVSTAAVVRDESATEEQAIFVLKTIRSRPLSFGTPVTHDAIWQHPLAADGLGSISSSRHKSSSREPEAVSSSQHYYYDGSTTTASRG